jgi:hypothetical protein
MQTNRLGKHAPLNIAAFADHFLRPVGMRDRLNILMDDRTFI